MEREKKEYVGKKKKTRLRALEEGGFDAGKEVAEDKCQV